MSYIHTIQTSIAYGIHPDGRSIAIVSSPQYPKFIAAMLCPYATIHHHPPPTITPRVAKTVTGKTPIEIAGIIDEYSGNIAKSPMLRPWGDG